VLVVALAAISILALATRATDPLEWLQAGLAAGLVAVLLYGRHHTTRATRRRQAHDRSVTRILQGLSGSLSPESVVDAIVEELRFSSGADHVVVARQSGTDGTLEVTLRAASAAVPPSRTLLRPDILGDPASSVIGDQAPLEEGAPRQTPPALGFQDAADEVARRVRSGYGLPFTLAAPLIAERRFVGALILSKRTREAWSDPDRRLLAWAAQEVSQAFARAYALEAAEARANIDALTGLPNRRYFDELMTMVRPRRRTGDELGILMIDIDRFKHLNDRYGHATGDVVLRAVAGAIHTTVRAEDTPARYGGEEFAVILRRASAAQAAEVAERVRQAVTAIPPERVGVEHPVTVSIGVAVAGERDDDVQALIERADRALYLAKRRGRDRVEAAAT
jgi:diguanylate cyclase (GGDEF)-like protein